MGILAFSLFGNMPKYVSGMFENIRLQPVVYPGWSVYVYSETGHPAIGDLRALGATVIESGVSVGFSGTLWRLAAMCEPTDAILIRDADSRINAREKAAVDAWLASGLKGHVMRDHPHHSMLDFMVGMLGVRGGVVPISAAPIFRNASLSSYANDNDVVRRCVWPLIKRSCMQHGFCGTPFPLHAGFTGEYVGQIWNSAFEKDVSRGIRDWD